MLLYSSSSIIACVVVVPLIFFGTHPPPSLRTYTTDICGCVGVDKIICAYTPHRRTQADLIS